MPGDAVEPRRRPLRGPHRVGLLRQNNERRLKRIFRGVGIAQDALADAAHHRPVPPDKRTERFLVALLPVTQQQFAVAVIRAVANPVEDSADRVKLGQGHRGLRRPSRM